MSRELQRLHHGIGDSVVRLVRDEGIEVGRIDSSSIERALSGLMVGPAELKFDTSAFLRANTGERMRSYQTAIMSGILTPNEAREREGMEPYYPNGDAFVMALPGAPMAGPGGNPDLPPVGTDADPPL